MFRISPTHQVKKTLKKLLVKVVVPKNLHHYFNKPKNACWITLNKKNTRNSHRILRKSFNITNKYPEVFRMSRKFTVYWCCDLFMNNLIGCVRSGQERFTWMTRVYYKEAQGCIIMFDLTSRNSFENAIKWKKDVDSKCSLEDGSPVPCMLLANKVSRLFINYRFIGLHR